MSIHKYNHPHHNFKIIRSAKDDRDIKFAAISKPLVILPSSVDLRPNCPEVYDQGALSSCTGNAIAAAFEYDMIKQGQKPFVPSRLFIYYNERVLECDVNEDNGAEIRDGIKTIAQNGVCDEALWPYEVTKFAVKPSDAAYEQAANHKALKYYSVDLTLQDVKQVLAQNFPIVAGIQIFNSFESDSVAQTGIVPMPSSTEPCLGGHAILLVGYDDVSQTILVRNSWGPDWGIKGYFTLPMQYITPSLMTDLWVVTAVK